MRCAGNLVESCNSGGTAWLESAECTAGCEDGLCTGACTPGATRCAGAKLQTCNGGGDAWDDTTTCATFCSTTTSACAVSPVEITTDTNMDGVIVVDGDFVVDPNATLTSPTGNLTIYADSITVQAGGSIVVTATGQNPAGAGGNENQLGGGGGYGTAGGDGYYYVPYEDIPAGAGPAFNVTTDAYVYAGASGGAGGGNPGVAGGGVLQLFANTINIAGQITANGVSDAQYGGAGSGGGVLLAGTTVTVSGTISTAAGTGTGEWGAGGEGVIKILSSAVTPSVTGTLNGAVVTEGLLPPLPITSTSHPDPTQIYNDNFSTFDFSWNPSFPNVQAYYVLGSTTETVPTPANGMFLDTAYTSLPESVLPGFDTGGADAGPGTGTSTLYFQIVPIDPSSHVGTVESFFTVAVNSSPPGVTSPSHPSQGTWYASQAPYFSWTYPVPNSALSGVYYVLDHYGDTIPDASSTLLPVVQQDLQLSGLDNGIWVFHLITRDTVGNFTKVATSYEVFIGTDPGSGSLTGTVVDATSTPVPNATVTVNRGIFSTTTNSSGVYNFSSIPALSWDVSVTSNGQTADSSATVTADGITTQNLTL